MSLVTPQGIRAQEDYDTAVEALSERLYTFIGDEPVTPGQLIKQFVNSGVDEDAVQEAMWRLLDARRAEITADRRLARLTA
ncbi:hypothetical protein ABH923_001112 [Leifsonia sp. EB41]|uniref:hypothetical protein n=1 Tax=Leifsonia sp. EB41 TaxID=3156260 RepID=UPI0035150BF8